jgi:GntR family transcriptional regulator
VRHTTARGIADQLAAAIDRGDYRPGERLPSILKLSEAHASDMVTARRALRLLADDAHAVHVERKGWFATG